MAYKPIKLLQTEFPDSTQSFLDSQKAYNDELSQMFNDQMKEQKDAILAEEKEQEELDKRMIEMAGKVVTPSTTNMFDSDYAIATQWADYLRDPENIDKFAESTEGMMEYNRLLSELNQFIAESQSYYSTNFGTPNDAMNASTWSGAFKRSRAKSEEVNVFDDQGLMDQNDEDFYSGQLALLDDPSAHSFQIVDGQAMIDGGLWRDRELMQNPFMANLTVSGFTNGYDYYTTEGASLANIHQTGEAAANWVKSKIPSSEKLRRDIARSFDTDNWKEVLNDEQKMQAATDAYLEDVKRAWRDFPRPKQTQTTAAERENARIRRENRESQETMVANMLESAYKTDATVDIPTGQDSQGRTLYTTVPHQVVYPVPDIKGTIAVNIDGKPAQFKVQQIIFDASYIPFDVDEDGEIEQGEVKPKQVVRLVGVDLENMTQQGGGSVSGIDTLIDLDIDPTTPYGQQVLSQLSLELSKTYDGLTLKDLQMEAFETDLRVVPIGENGAPQRPLVGAADGL